jgi:geranylgeranyl diphosphate synthase, type II
MTQFKNLVDSALADYFRQMEVPQVASLVELKKSMEYSVLGGGKRFRPILSMMLAESFGQDVDRVLPFGCAVELVHTYSLIHDDLPSMDNDDFRRGEPTNHKVFGEPMALLAGDALLTQAFALLSKSYHSDPGLCVDLIAKLSEAIGLMGMVGGQALDISISEAEADLEFLNRMHAMKTGALIRVAVEGAAMICDLDQKQIDMCRDFGAYLGLAFQLVDDLLDASTEGNQLAEVSGFPFHLGVDKTRDYVNEVTARAYEILRELKIENGPLAGLLQMNLTREL